MERRGKKQGRKYGHDTFVGGDGELDTKRGKESGRREGKKKWGGYKKNRGRVRER